MEKLLLK